MIKVVVATSLLTLSSTSAVNAQTAGKIMPSPPVPMPTAGNITCQIKSADGADASFEGQLALSRPRSDEDQHPVVNFSGSDRPELTGQFSAKWSASGGDFLGYSEPYKVITTMRYLGSVFLQGQGGVIVEVAPLVNGKPIYYVGFCQADFQSGRVSVQ